MVAVSTIIALLPLLSSAQFPPPRTGFTEVESKYHAGVKISYKESSVCETTPGVKSYSGYVHLPPHSLNEKHENQSYPINTFFWFFESRKDPDNAPLSIWLNGGPGGSSLMGALTENGPCFVGNDSNSTYLNPWSWNNEVNLLFIDQPVQVGFSYDTATNITKDLADGGLFEQKIEVLEEGAPIPEQNNTFLVGTTGSQEPLFTANSTRHASHAFWHFAQTWFQEFPKYKPHDDRISLYTESYGGRYGPVFARTFIEQNDKIDSGKLDGFKLHLDTLGIVNGEYLTRSYIDFPWNNTYGIKAYTEAQYHRAQYHYYKKDGIVDKLKECQRLDRVTSPSDQEGQLRVARLCQEAYDYSSNLTDITYSSSGNFSRYDITHVYADPFPPPYLNGFLNQHWVQAALGVPVNHSAISENVWSAFHHTGDHARGHQLEDIGFVLDHGVKVHLLYGDRDFACNWLGGESSSLKVPWKHQKEFARAGYAPLIVTGEPYTQSHGQTRQYGNFSFTRVYQAGHLVPSYQPEAAFRMFMRGLLNLDIATGKVNTAEETGYGTEGPPDTWWMKSDVLPSPEGICYALDPGTCSDEEKGWLMDGTAVVENWIVIGREEDGKNKGYAGPGKMGQEPLNG
ncbi:Carboxypeptidase Y A [Sphaceloma murrayae]|uniref:Carboxypeptidase n=1 Tax=Sphaceloma murrayae TaxID=2082308 RepID=A0A2K1QK71_9PEZI|nr:Carboxypeptidase Y A [Sphaceloma murrayae]